MASVLHANKSSGIKHSKADQKPPRKIAVSKLTYLTIFVSTQQYSIVQNLIAYWLWKHEFLDRQKNLPTSGTPHNKISPVWVSRYFQKQCRVHQTSCPCLV